MRLKVRKLLRFAQRGPVGSPLSPSLLRLKHSPCKPGKLKCISPKTPRPGEHLGWRPVRSARVPAPTACLSPREQSLGNSSVARCSKQRVQIKSPAPNWVAFPKAVPASERSSQADFFEHSSAQSSSVREDAQHMSRISLLVGRLPSQNNLEIKPTRSNVRPSSFQHRSLLGP